MFAGYFEADDRDGTEYGRAASLAHGMCGALTGLPTSAAAGSPIDMVDQAFPGAPIAPSTLLRNAMDHTLLDLGHVMGIVEQSGRQVSVPAIMGNIRTSLLSASHLCYAISPADARQRLHHIGELYDLEMRSAAKFVKEVDKQDPSVLPGLRPPPDAAVRQLASYANPYPPAQRVTESLLLGHMKEQVLGPLLTQLKIDESHAALLVDHMFNTTSGAAHGYSWIDLEGVICHFVAHFTYAVSVANLVFNDYFRALGRHPTRSA